MSHKEDLADTEMDDATSSPRRSRRKKVTRALYHETDEPTGLDDQTLQIVYKLGETAWSDDELTQFYESYSIDKAHVHVATRSKEQIQALIDLHGGSAVLDTLTEKEFVPLHKQIVAKYDVPLSPSRKRKTPTRKRPDLFLNLETTPTSPNNTSSTTTSTSHISTPTSAKRKLKSLTDDEIVYKHHPRKQKFDLVLPMDAQIALQAVPPTPVTEERTKSLPAKLRGKAQVVTSGVIVSNSARVPVQVLNDDDEQTATATLPNVEQASQKLYKAIQISKMRQFCVCEWFYPSIDFFYYEKSEFLEFAKITLPELPINEFMKKRDWNYIRGKLGKPRRLSQAYLSEEKQKMHTFRQAVRLYYKLHIYKAEADSLDADDDSDATKRNLEFDMLSILDDYDIPAPLQPGEKVLIRSLDGNHIYSGTVLDTRHNYLAIDKKKKRKRSETVNHLSLFQEYNVQFDYDKSEKFVPDWCVMSMLKPGSISNGIERKTTLIEVRKKLQEHDALRTPPSKRSRAAPTTPAPPLREAEMSMAECINLLKKKDKMLTQLTVMNDEVKKLLEKNSEVNLSKEFQTRYAYIVLQLRQLNIQINDLLAKFGKYPQSLTQNTPSRPVAPFITNEYQGPFSMNRSLADKIVKQSLAVALQDPTFVNATNEEWKSAKSLGVAQECIAFLYHIHSCVNDENMQTKDAIGFLDASLLALKPKYFDTPQAEQVYIDISNLVQQIKHTLCNQ